MTSKRIHSDTSGSRRMAWMDWFGLIALGLLMVCSLVLLGQLLNLDPNPSDVPVFEENCS